MPNDPAYSSRGRLLLAGLVALMVVGGLFFLVLGLVTFAGGHRDSWLVALGGLQFTVLGVLGVTAMVPSRHTPGPAVEVEGAVALPLRHGYAGRQALMAVTLGTMLLPTALHTHNDRMVFVGSVALVVGLAAAVWLPLGGADSFRIRLTPDELVLPSGWGPVDRFSWDDIEGAQALPRWQPPLVILPKDDLADMGIVKLLTQGWSPDALMTVIDHYAEHPAKRSELTSAAAVEAVAFGSAISTAPERRR